MRGRMAMGLVLLSAANGCTLSTAQNSPTLPATVSKVPDVPVAASVPLPPAVGWADGYDKEVAEIKPLLMNLWPGDAPNQTANPPQAERNDGERIWAVNVPGMLVYLPAKERLAASGGTCIIACMGGAYSHLTRLVGADGTVEEFAPKGMAVVSLKYRLTPATTNPERDAVLDLARAIRLVRLHAKEWGVDPAKIGTMGWSAGGNMIVSLCTHLKNNGDGDPAAADPVEWQNCRPDFVALWSPWPNARTVDAYVAESGVKLPPAIIGGAKDDKTAPFTFVSGIKENWERAGATVEFVTVDTGGHSSFELNVGTAKDWPAKFLPWMEKGGWWKHS